jgi:hypothetical protein
MTFARSPEASASAVRRVRSRCLGAANYVSQRSLKAPDYIPVVTVLAR